MKYLSVLFALLFVGATSAGIDLDLEPGESQAIAGALSVVGMIVLRIIMKQLKVSKKTVVGKIIWGLASALLGDGVVLQNNSDKEDVARIIESKSPALRAAARALRR